MYKKEFPIYRNKPDLAYWDSAASSLKLQSALDAEYRFATENYANVHRGVYQLSYEATRQFEEARETVAKYFNSHKEGLIFVKGATEGINMFANALVIPTISFGKNIIITQAEHHSNILPWREICRKFNCELRIAQIDKNGSIDINHLHSLVDNNTHAIAITHSNNITGAITDISWIKDMKERGIWTLIDGAQYAAHKTVNFREIGCDAYVLSAHKMYGPNGIGALILSDNAQKSCISYQLGGGMAYQVKEDDVILQDMPWRLEAGTPHITGAIGFKKAIEYLASNSPTTHEHEIFEYLYTQWLNEIKTPIITDPHGIGILSFDIPSIHPHDIATLCDHYSIAIRAGQHCASPFLKALGHSSLSRASIGIYNDKQDVDKLIFVIKELTRTSHVG